MRTMLFWLLLAGCSSGDLRGEASRSVDGRTYLVVDDVPSRDCELYLDGRPYRTALHRREPVSPGEHALDCRFVVRVEEGEQPAAPPDGSIGFRVEPGTTFHFDDWGP